MVQLILKNDMVILPSWIPFVSKEPQLILSTNGCMEKSNQYVKSENIFTVQSFLNTLAFSDQLMLDQLKGHNLDSIDLKNKVTENFWNWTLSICKYIHYNILKEFDLNAMNDYENNNINNNDNNNDNIICLSAPELAAFAQCHNEYHDSMDVDENKQDTELEILNIHKNLCMELLSIGKDLNVDKEKKVFFLWWFMTYNLLKLFNKRLNIYSDEKFENILKNDMLNEEYDFNVINFIHSTQSSFDYFTDDLLSYSKYYLNHLDDNALLLFFKEEPDYEKNVTLINTLKKNNIVCIPTTNDSLYSKMMMSSYYKEQCLYKSIKEAKNINEFTVTKQLGKGSCGFVRNAIHNKTGKKVIIKYVVKSLILRGCWMDSKDFAKYNINLKCSSNRRFPNEIAVLQYIHDELNGNVPNNLTKLITYWEDSFYYYLVFDATDFDSDLFDYIDKSPNGLMPEMEAKTIFKKILEAVQILHHHNIVHRDIKDENILINYKTKDIQLIDFGSSAFYEKNKKLTNFVGSFLFAAPEIIKGMSYEGPQQDIWSLGILLYTMIYKVTPFNDYYEILRNTMKFPSGISEECKELILWMTNKDISKRPTIDDILNHPWIQY